MSDYLSKMKYVSGDCGSGKTYALIQKVLNNIKTNPNAKYLIVQGTLHLTQQTAQDIGNAAKLITSGTSKNVHSDITDFLLNPSHQVLVCTDIAFLQIRDNSLLKNWKIYLDDVVNFHKFTCKNTALKEEVETKLFESYEAVGTNHVTAQPQTKFDDDLIKVISTDFAYLNQYDHFLLNAGFFEKIGATDMYKEQKGQLQIMSWCDLGRYEGLDITFMANDFENSLVYLSDPTRFERTALSLRERAVPVLERMRVHYFSHVPLTATLREYSPEQFTKAIDWINSNLTDYIFTVNSDQKKTVLNGTYISPKSRGINEYKEYTNAVWFSSLKPSNVEVKQCEIMFHLTYEQIVQAREREEMYQFIMRSKLRDYNSAEIVDVYVFDKEQALSLCDDPIFIDLDIKITNSAKAVSTFVPLKLSSSQKKAYERITLEQYPTRAEFDKFMNKKGQLLLTEQQRTHFIVKYESL